MEKQTKKRIVVGSCIVVAGIATVALVRGCNNDEDKWVNSPGTNGHINLEAIKKVFRKSPKIEDFENRVNEIFEGDMLVLFESQKTSGGFKMSAREDLDGDKKVSSGDDLLFTLVVANGTATLKGAGVTSYYESSWVYEPAEHARKEGRSTRSGYHYMYFYHWYGYGGYRWGGGYYTPAPRYNSMMAHRTSYRGSSAFASQVQANAKSEQKMATRYGSSFRKSATKTSSTRKSYVSKGVRSGSYKSGKSTSGWGARSSSGTKSSFSSSRGSSSRGFGGFRGSSGFGV